MKYRSEIRESQIRNLRQKVEDLDYSKYLLEMHIHRLRAFQNARIRFRFPVTALIGPNAGGKSTILGAAALMYAWPSRFFPMSTVDETGMRDLKVAYTLIDRTQRKDGTIERSATHPRRRWKRRVLNRRLLFFGTRRTIPATEKSEFTKYRTGVTRLAEEEYAALSPEVIDHASRILGIDLSRYSRSTGKRPLIGYSNGVKHSEFHFGAGISVIIELVWNLENLTPSDQALVLIEDVEATLHPYAVRKFVEYLISVAERKRCQIIFTTHCEYALDPLPREAIWAARDGLLINGRLRVEDMLVFRGDIDTQLAIYCEDATAIAWIQGMMRFAGSADDLNRVEFYAVGGHGDVKNKTHSHNEDPARRFSALGFVDGDAPEDMDLGTDIHRLPGRFMPEEVILEGIRENYESNLALLTAHLTRRTEEQALVRREIDLACQDTEDMHLIFSKIGVRLGFIPEEPIRLGLIATYCSSYPDEARRIAGLIHGQLPANGAGMANGQK